MRNRFYRPEIDGLRALAVLPVVFYHLGWSLFSGGYVGVDIFFVVSGYLITQIIMRHIDEDGFSIALFYERRARRIAPALIVVLLFCSVLAGLLFLPDDLLRFSDSLAATVLFSSNFLFWTETGYFAAPSEFKPLLHTWSLAVEEQFYIVYPLLMLLVHRYWRRSLLPLLWLGFLASFALSVWGSVHTPGAAFFLAPTRAWELILGALLALSAVPRPAGAGLRTFLAVLGLGLIAWAVFGFTAETRFPGLAALAPCLGAGLIIHATSRDDRGVGRLLSWRPLVAVGLISYSLYLWHWPLIVFTKYYLVRPLQTGEIVLLLAASLALAWASWRWVEQPFRKGGGVFGRRRLFSATAAAGLALIAVSLALRHDGGLSERFLDAEIQLLSDAKNRPAERLNCLDLAPEKVLAGELCVIGEPSKNAPSFLLWGDSHASALAPGLDEAARRAGQWGYHAFWVSCPPLLGVENIWKPPNHQCRAFNDAMLSKALELQVEDVVMVAMWSAYPIGRIQEAGSGKRDVASSRAALQRGLQRTVGRLGDAGMQVWIVEQVPWARHDVPQALALSRRFGIEMDDVEPLVADHDRQQAFVRGLIEVAALAEQARLIIPAEKLCDAVSCRVMAEGKSLYSDDDHLSEFGARWISELFEPVFESKP